MEFTPMPTDGINLLLILSLSLSLSPSLLFLSLLWSFFSFSFPFLGTRLPAVGAALATSLSGGLTGTHHPFHFHHFSPPISFPRDNDPSFDNWSPFGGWSNPAMKQYTGTPLSSPPSPFPSPSLRSSISSSICHRSLSCPFPKIFPSVSRSTPVHFLPFSLPFRRLQLLRCQR